MNDTDVGIGTVFSFLLFGTNFLLFILFQLIKYQDKRSISDKSHAEKKHSLPFDGTVACYTNLTTEIFITGCIIILTYIFENHWFFEHSQKEYSRDLFMFVLVLFFLYAVYTIKPITDLTLLGRDQTEEWKGWMQFIFLLYHYFHAEEVYNSVRVMITCYVWMTGFGNFSFFYIKQDFGWLRVVQMLWRLNFSVLLLMLIHGNTYILYYICPLHTFYFAMVYITMYTMQSVNHTKWGIRVKLLVVGVIVYLVWDTAGPVFDFFFWWLGTDSVIGAKSGSLWEWYFRTSLDHWSSFYGMIFALNFPVAEQFFKVAAGWPLRVTAVILFCMTVWWFYYIYSMEKLEYNLHHSYFAFVPLTAYIFFRNISPTVRSGVSMSLHALGKTTLETYLLQHHVWLTSNAKTLLTLVPGMPWVNFALATVLFFFLSKELYRLTMSLRGMILPDNRDIALRNGLGAFFVLAIFGGVAFILHAASASAAGVALACVLLFVMISLVIKRVGRGVSDNDAFNLIWRRMFLAAVVVIFLGLVADFSLLGSSPTGAGNSHGPSTLQQHHLTGALARRCRRSLASGHWLIENKCNTDKPVPAVCMSYRWVWDDVNTAVCQLHHIDAIEGSNIFKNKRVIFIGDSTVRSVYHQFNRLIDVAGRYSQPLEVDKHSDMEYSVPGTNTVVEFKWAPFISNITHILKAKQNGDLCVAGGGLWDALHNRDRSKYVKHLANLSEFLEASEREMASQLVWILPLPVIDAKLNTDDKRAYMTETIADIYRSEFKTSGVYDDVFATIDSSNITRGREDTSIDGVHYSPDVYAVIAELVANIYNAHHSVQLPSVSGTSKYSNPFPHGKPTGSMSSPVYGAIVLSFAAIMLFSWDSFLGVGFLSLKVFRKSLSWNDAYLPLLNKVLQKNEDELNEEQEKESLLEMKSSATV